MTDLTRLQELLYHADVETIVRDLKYLRKADEVAARLAQTAGESSHYRSALEEIANPIAAMQKRLEPGCRLNGGMAVSLSESAEYLKGIAKRALASAPTSEAT